MSSVLKENLKHIDKVWGRELWIINCPEYCGKLLYLEKEAESSYHRHRKKKETFYCLVGQVALTIKRKSYMLNPFSRPKTIKPGQFHSFRGIANSVILEISTHHDEGDVERVTRSKAGINDDSFKNALPCELFRRGN